MALAIITDSSCDMPPELEQTLGIEVMAMTVSFGEDSYLVGRTLDDARFYELLGAGGELPLTAQLTPIQFEEIYRPHVEAGDSIVVLPISRELSGTYNNALMARQAFPGADIHVVDTLNTTFGLGLLVTIAAKWRNEGMSAADIAAGLETLRDKVRLYAVIGDLKLLSRGGRLSSAGAVVGTLLGIKPIISVQAGKVVNTDKVRGMRAGYQTVVDCMMEKGVDSAYPVFFGHAMLPEAAGELAEVAGLRMDFDEAYTTSIGPVVGSHIGFGAAGMAAIERD